LKTARRRRSERERGLVAELNHLARHAAYAELLIDHAAKRNGGWIPGDRRPLDRWLEREARRIVSELNRVRLGDPQPSADAMDNLVLAVYDCGQSLPDLGETAVPWAVVRTYLMALWGWSFDLAEETMWTALHDMWASGEPPDSWPVLFIPGEDGGLLLLQGENEEDTDV